MLVLAIVTLLVGFAHDPARGQTFVVAPNSAATVEGNADNFFPFNPIFSGKVSQRYQQVYAAAQFGGAGVAFISGVAFRPSAEPSFSTYIGPFSVAYTNVELRLSTSAKQPGGLSTIFTENVGADEIVVRSGPLNLSSSFTGPAGGPKDFDIVIHFDNPFSYDPSQGNLLLEIRNFGGGNTTLFDAVSPFAQGTSRLFSTEVDGVSSTSGRADGLALVTQFTVIPEPSSLALLCIGLGLLSLRHGVSSHCPNRYPIAPPIPERT